MPSLSLRTITTAVVLSTMLCLAAAPATAQPRGNQEPSRVEANFATRVWLWLTRISAPAEPRHSQERSLAERTTSTDQSLDPTVLGRAGAFDPNG